MASSDSINYALRPSKAVGRKIVFETLTALAPIYDFTTYRYIGFGALWFVDFVLAHRSLFISDMVSIEKDEYHASRAEFNKPYACVSVKPGESSSVLPDLSIEEKPILAWLDYDTGLDGPVLDDLSTLCQRALVGSMIIVTLNANPKRLLPNGGDGPRATRMEEKLRDLAGNLIPQQLPEGALTTLGYPNFLGSLMFQHMHRQVRISGKENASTIPLINIRYKDNSTMVVIGIAIIDSAQVKNVEEQLGIPNTVGRMREDYQVQISVPPLTLKEKTTLDQMMPCDGVPTEEAVETSTTFRLRLDQIEAYHRFYRYYPTFGEIF